MYILYYTSCITWHTYVSSYAEGLYTYTCRLRDPSVAVVLKARRRAIAVFTYVMRGLQSTWLASVAQNIQSDTGFYVRTIFVLSE